ncbi:hypothetical protein LCGC14_2094340, partial [marine sediment metagenome]
AFTKLKPVYKEFAEKVESATEKVFVPGPAKGERFAKPPEFKDLGDPARWYQFLAESGPLMGVLVGMTAINVPMGVAAMYTVESGQTLKDMDDYEKTTGTTISLEKRAAIAGGVGIMNAAFEYAGVAKILGVAKVSGIKGKALAWLSATAVEDLTEGGQGMVSKLGEYLYDEVSKEDKNIANVLKAGWQDMIAALPISLFAPGAMALSPAAQAKVEAEAPTKGTLDYGEEGFNIPELEKEAADAEGLRETGREVREPGAEREVRPKEGREVQERAKPEKPEAVPPEVTLEPVKTAKFKEFQEVKDGVDIPVFDLLEGGKVVNTVLTEQAVKDFGAEVPAYEKPPAKPEPKKVAVKKKPKRDEAIEEEGFEEIDRILKYRLETTQAREERIEKSIQREVNKAANIRYKAEFNESLTARVIQEGGIRPHKRSRATGKIPELEEFRDLPSIVKRTKRGGRPIDEIIDVLGISESDLFSGLKAEERMKDRIRDEIESEIRHIIEEREATKPQTSRRIKKIKDEREIIKRRRKRIQGIQDHFGLSDTVLKGITRRDIRLMTDWDFKQFIDKIEIKAVELQKKSEAKAELMNLIAEKRFVKWQNLQKAQKLPPVDKMTTAQLGQFLEALEGYQPYDEFLSIRKLETVDKTDLAGIKTMREAREKLAKQLNIPIEGLETISVGDFDRLRYD